MARYIDVEKLIDFKFSYITNERYKDGKRKSEDEIYAYKVGYNEAIDNIIRFATTAEEEKVAIEYCMKKGLVMIPMDYLEKVIAYENRGTVL